jgi:hypothetical protein
MHEVCFNGGRVVALAGINAHTITISTLNTCCRRLAALMRGSLFTAAVSALPCAHEYWQLATLLNEPCCLKQLYTTRTRLPTSLA